MNTTSLTTRPFVPTVLVLGLCLFGSPVFALVQSSAASQMGHPAPVRTPTGIKANKKLPAFAPPAARLEFSAQPTDAEIFQKSPFEDPLVPMNGTTTMAENQQLAAALVAFSKRSTRDDFHSLETFFSTHPQSPWRESLLTNLGALYRYTGWYSKAMDTWQTAWNEGQKLSVTGPARMVVDRALANLIVLNASVGRMDELEKLIAISDQRILTGSSRQKVENAKQGLASMKTQPDVSFRCGPLALERLRNLEDHNELSKLITKSLGSTTQGTSLSQLVALARQLAIPYHAAKRTPGSAVLVPSVVNWKLNHYAAITEQRNHLYHLKDPTFGDDVWVSPAALDDGASGYFLVKDQTLPKGWSSVSEAEAATVWGKGDTSGVDPDDNEGPTPQGGGDDGGGNDGGGPGGPGSSGVGAGSTGAGGNNAGNNGNGGGGGGCGGMARYSVFLAATSLTVRDTPVFYSTAFGPRLDFTVTYSQREANQPSTFTYSNFGPLWTMNWLSYLTDDPNNPGADVRHYLSGGGTLTYTGYTSSTQTYAPQAQTGCVLKITGSSSYELDEPDGSKQIFSVATLTTPRKLLMTQTIDPQGNALTFSYDSMYRLIAATDALGQVTTLSYGSPTDPYKVTQVIDPFGRTANFAYTLDGFLASSTDVIGITSQYGYTNGVMTSLTTPYGTTNFNVGQDSNKRWVQITDTQGALERFETWNNVCPYTPFSESIGAPSGVANLALNYRNTFYWNKKAMQVGAGDYTKARITHWLHEPNIATMSDQVESTKAPLESRIFYSYANQPQPYITGTSGQPIRIARLVDGASAGQYVTQQTQFQYNTNHNLTQKIDPVGRTTNYTYAANGIDLMTVTQVNGSKNDLLVSNTYYPNHRVQNTTDASGQTTKYTYTTQGQIQGVTNPSNQVTTYTYGPDHQVNGITGTKVQASLYDGLGRLRTVENAQGLTVTYDYDNLNRITVKTYSDGSYEQNVYTNLDITQQRDRQGRWTRYFYNNFQQLIAVIDPADRVTNYDRCTCGALKGIIDPLGHRTSWDQDLEGRTISKTFPDGTQTLTTYYPSTSRLDTVTDAKGQVTTYTYNLDDTISSTAYSNTTIPTPTVSFTFDPAYRRIATMMDGTGTTTFTYNPTQAGTLGSNRLASITGPLGATSTETYSYDALGRVNGLSINGTSNPASWMKNDLNQISSTTNLLGTFTYSYSPSSHSQTISCPQAPTINYVWPATVNTVSDMLFQEIKNVAGTQTISDFNYTYNPAGTISTWKQQTDSNTPNILNYQYDAADQLLNAAKSNTVSQAVLGNSVYGYDLAGNRTSEQTGLNVVSATYNANNQLTGRTGGGPVQFTGTISKPGTVTVNGLPAQVNPQANSTNIFNFIGSTFLNPGTNTVPVVAQDFNGTTPTTNKFQFVMPAVSGSAPAYDLDGNMTNDGLGRTFEWDARNEMTAINYATPVKIKLSGAVIGTAGSYNNNGNTIAKAFDGNNATYFDGPAANGDWLGLDLGAGNTASITQIQYVPRASYASRMVGGVFQGSNTANFSSGVVTLATISSTPSSATNVVTITGASVYRYVRYLAPNNGYGNIAELEFDSTVNRTEFSYDGLSRRVKIVEKNGSSVVLTKQDLWVEDYIAEERDAGNNVTKRYFKQGVQIGASNYYYTFDHLGSIREVLNSSGAIQARYDYDSYGRVTLVQGTNLADFQYAGDYAHATSGLDFTQYRAYDPNTAHWLSRDPIAEKGGINLYQFVSNDPVIKTDFKGLDSSTGGGGCGGGNDPGAPPSQDHGTYDGGCDPTISYSDCLATGKHYSTAAQLRTYGNPDGSGSNWYRVWEIAGCCPDVPDAAPAPPAPPAPPTPPTTHTMDFKAPDGTLSKTGCVLLAQNDPSGSNPDPNELQAIQLNSNVNESLQINIDESHIHVWSSSNGGTRITDKTLLSFSGGGPITIYLEGIALGASQISLSASGSTDAYVSLNTPVVDIQLTMDEEEMNQIAVRKQDIVLGKIYNHPVTCHLTINGSLPQESLMLTGGDASKNEDGIQFQNTPQQLVDGSSDSMITVSTLSPQTFQIVAVHSCLGSFSLGDKSLLIKDINGNLLKKYKLTIFHFDNNTINIRSGLNMSVSLDSGSNVAKIYGIVPSPVTDLNNPTVNFRVDVGTTLTPQGLDSSHPQISKLYLGYVQNAYGVSYVNYKEPYTILGHVFYWTDYYASRFVPGNVDTIDGSPIVLYQAKSTGLNGKGNDNSFNPVVLSTNGITTMHDSDIPSTQFNLTYPPNYYFYDTEWHETFVDYGGILDSETNTFVPFTQDCVKIDANSLSAYKFSYSSPTPTINIDQSLESSTPSMGFIPSRQHDVTLPPIYSGQTAGDVWANSYNANNPPVSTPPPLNPQQNLQ